MKRTIYIALILCLAVTLMAGCGKKKNGSGPTGPAIPEVGTILWNFETEEEVAKFDNDNTGAEIEYNTEIVAQGTAAAKVTPSGEAGETKIAAVLDQDKISAWNASKNLVLKIYMERTWTRRSTVPLLESLKLLVVVGAGWMVLRSILPGHKRGNGIRVSLI